MKYTETNELSHFQYHDVKIDSVPSVNAKPEDFFDILLNPKNIPCYIMWIEKLSVIDSKQGLSFDINSNTEFYDLDFLNQS